MKHSQVKPWFAVRSVTCAVLAAMLACGVAPAAAFAEPAEGSEISADVASGVSTQAEVSSAAQWTTLLGATGTSGIVGLCDSVAQTQRLLDGGFVAAATLAEEKAPSSEHAKGKADAVLARYDVSGTELWRSYVEGEKADAFSSVTETDDGGFLAVGVTQSTSFDLEGKARGGKDGLLAKFDADGNVAKTATFGGSDKDELTRVTPALDGGYIAVGYTNSTDGDIAQTCKAGKDSDAVIAKFDDDLNLVWVTRVGGTEDKDGTTGAMQIDSFVDVVQMQGAHALDSMGEDVEVSAGYVAIGYSNANDGDLSGANKGGQDVLVAKFDANGKVEWVRSFGGSAEDKATSIARAASTNSVPSEGTPTYDNGFVISGTTKSTDGAFAGREAADASSAGFVMRLSATGEVRWTSLLEDSSVVTADSVVCAPEGYLVAGVHSAADLDFTGMKSYGKKDAYVAHLSEDGVRLGTETLGGADDESVARLAPSGTDDYLLCGYTKSNDGMFAGTQGKTDGFVSSISADALLTHAEQKTLVPVAALKANEDTSSMMAPMLYKDAYVERTGGQYTVTVYFTRATIMGSEVSPTILGAVSYDRGDGVMVDAVSDSYDEKTRVKSSTIRLTSLDKPVMIHIEGFMGDVRLSFDAKGAVETETPPYFAPVEVTLPDFDYTWKDMLGGTNDDYAADSTMLSNGNLLVAGQTYSQDGDFDGLQRGPACAFVQERDAHGNVVRTFELGGMENGYSAYAASVDATADGGFVLCGGYTSPDGVPAGDFASLNVEGAVFGQTDSYVARYNAAGELLWMTDLSGSGHDQAKRVRATADGGCVALFETSSHDGDLAGDANRGIFNLVVVKYDADGVAQWQRTIGGTNLESSDFGLDVLADGKYVVAGIKSSYNYDFADAAIYGNTFDLFATKLSAQTGESVWLNTYGGSSNEYLNGVTATSDGGFIMVGDTKSGDGTFASSATGYDNSYVMKLNAAGNVEWTSMLKSSEYNEAERVAELADRYVVLGNSNGTDFDFKGLNKGSSDVYVAQFDKAGNRLTLDVIGGSSADSAAQITAVNDYQLNVLLHGKSNDGDFALRPQGGDDVMLLTYDWRQAPVVADKLEQAISLAGTLVASNYTPESWAIVQDRLAAAQEVLADASATQEQVDEAAAALQLAIDGLAKAEPTPKPDPNPTPEPSPNPGPVPAPGAGDDAGNDDAANNGAGDDGVADNNAAVSNGNGNGGVSAASNNATMAQTGDVAGNVAAVSVVVAVMAAATALGSRIRHRLSVHERR